MTFSVELIPMKQVFVCLLYSCKYESTIWQSYRRIVNWNYI